MLKAIIRTTACLAVSATAFIVITKMDATAAKPRSPSVPEASEPKTAPRKPAPPAPPPPKLTVASLTTPPRAPAATTEPPSKSADAAALSEPPSWKGKRLSLARREARSLGFKVTAVDESGEPVPAAMGGIYRVRRQLAQTDAAIQFVVREIVAPAAGY
jgi:hypothetical protein